MTSLSFWPDGSRLQRPDELPRLWVTGSPYNDVGWSNEEYDNLIAQAKASADPVERMELMGQAEKILLDDAAIIPVYWPQRNYAEHAWVKNIVRSAIGPQNDWKFAYTEGRPGGDNKLALNLGEEPPDLQSITTTDQVSFDIVNATLEGMPDWVPTAPPWARALRKAGPFPRTARPTPSL